MTNLNTAHKKKLDVDYYILQNEFAATFTFKQKLGFSNKVEEHCEFYVIKNIHDVKYEQNGYETKVKL